MKALLGSLILVPGLAISAGSVMAENAIFRLAVSRNDGIPGGALHVDVEVATTGSISPRILNSLTVDVEYSGGIAGFVDPNEGVDSWGVGGGSQDYVWVQTRPAVGQYRILIAGTSVGINVGGDPAGFEVSSDFRRVVTLKWKVTTASEAFLSVSPRTVAAAYFEKRTNASTANAIEWMVSLSEGSTVSVPLSAAVPIELAQFTAEATDMAVQLAWRTETETENFGFHIARSETRQGPYHSITQQIIRGAGTSAAPHHYSYTDTRVQAANTYYYKLSDIDLGGNVTLHGPVWATVKSPRDYVLEQNFPNPFNSNTAIKFVLAAAGKATLRVFNSRGRLIRTLVDRHYPAGHGMALWDGRNENGTLAASGIYLYKLEVNSFSQFKRMTLLK